MFISFRRVIMRICGSNINNCNFPSVTSCLFLWPVLITFWLPLRGAQEIEWVRWKGTYVLNHLPESLAHCLQVQRQKANIKTGFSSQWPLLAQPLQDELWSLHPLCITRDKEIITKLLMPMQLVVKTNHEGRWKYIRKRRWASASDNSFQNVQKLYCERSILLTPFYQGIR